MYENYFGLSEPPFENNLDQRFFFLSDNHKEVLEALLFFVREGKGFALVCGDVGTGKTMLINSFLDNLPDSVKFIILSNPDATYLSTLRYVARKLGIDAAEMDALELFDEVKAALSHARRQGERFVLIIDEAHLLSDEAFEGVRLLSNIETRQEKLLQILLVGQYELSHKLDRVEIRQLRERININRFLCPMDQSETIAYIDHRLKIAGGSFNSCFEVQCRSLIYEMTQGIPRRINLLCDHALLVCASLQLPKVNRKVLKYAQDALHSDRIFSPRDDDGSDSGLASHIPKLTIAGQCVIVLILVAILLYRAPSDSSIKRIIAYVIPSAILPEKNTESAQSLPASADITEQEQTEKPAMSQKAVPAQADTKKEPDAQLPPQTMERPTIAQREAKSALNNDGPQTEIVRRSSADANPDRKQKPRSALNHAGRQTEIARRSSTDANPNHKQKPRSALNHAGRQTEIARRSSADVNPSRKQKPKSALSSDSNLQKQKLRTVKRGDTLLKIASESTPNKPEHELHKILRLNPSITDHDRIYPGQVIVLSSLDTPNNHEVQTSQNKKSLQNSPSYQTRCLLRQTQKKSAQYANTAPNRQNADACK